ncbi:MAG: phosphate-starvation-inducible PsiE family protein [Sedimenticola sp.]|nr:phosphate-starvation-inducible PsiE family protein [Sedimenticola sp.]
MQVKIQQLFNRLTSFVFAVILGFLILGILIGTAKLFLNLGGLLTVPEITGTYKLIITDVLSLFILVELSRSLADYFEHQRLQLSFILDAGIVFALREIMIKLFNHEIMPAEIYAMSVLILVLGILRTATILLFQHEKKLLKQLGEKKPA